MYTRNYRQLESRPENSIDQKSEDETVTELPPGYSGTALLRERESEVIDKEAPCVEAEPAREERRVRRYKMIREPACKSTCEERYDGEEINEPTNDCLDIKKPPRGRLCLRERTFSIEDMLLAALIVLLLGEGADDMTVLILGFLLISEL